VLSPLPTPNPNQTEPQLADDSKAEVAFPDHFLPFATGTRLPKSQPRKSAKAAQSESTVLLPMYDNDRGDRSKLPKHPCQQSPDGTLLTITLHIVWICRKISWYLPRPNRSLGNFKK
jgi:hypothetical protein